MQSIVNVGFLYVYYDCDLFMNSYGSYIYWKQMITFILRIKPMYHVYMTHTYNGSVKTLALIPHPSKSIKFMYLENYFQIFSCLVHIFFHIPAFGGQNYIEAMIIFPGSTYCKNYFATSFAYMQSIVNLGNLEVKSCIL